MFSLRPGTPERMQQMPRTTSSIVTPACDAAYSASIISSSASEFIFIVMWPSLPSAACSAIRSTRRGASVFGATSSRR